MLQAVEPYAAATASLSFAPQVIRVPGKKYLLHFPLRCLLEKEDDFFIVKSEQLDLIGTGQTEAEAKTSFCQEFDFIFQRYNQLSDDRLSPRLRDIKTMLNLFVKSVE